MYTSSMRRIQIYIEESLDDVLRVESARTGRSKAALIRACVAERFKAPRESELKDDPLSGLVGSIDAEPVEDIDEVIYGR